MANCPYSLNLWVNYAIRKPNYIDFEFHKRIGEKVYSNRQIQGLPQRDLAFNCNDKDYSQIN